MSNVFIDSRVGSKHLLDPLKIVLNGGHRVDLTQLEYGDIAWEGSGDGGPIPIGVEVTRINDLLQKIKSRRLVDHQVPGLVKSYNVAYLLIEGRWRVKVDGGLEVFSSQVYGPPKWHGSGFRYDSVQEFLTSLQSFPRLIVERTETTEETVNWLAAKIRWWGKPWSEHKSFNAWAGVTLGGSMLDFREPSLAQKFAALLPGVGQDRAFSVAKKFGSAYNMATSKEEDWVGIKAGGKTKTGRERVSISKAGAERILEAIKRKED